jgi:hypothetical protein
VTLHKTDSATQGAAEAKSSKEPSISCRASVEEERQRLLDNLARSRVAINTGGFHFTCHGAAALGESKGRTVLTCYNKTTTLLAILTLTSPPNIFVTPLSVYIPFESTDTSAFPLLLFFRITPLQNLRPSPRHSRCHVRLSSRDNN